MPRLDAQPFVFSAAFDSADELRSLRHQIASMLHGNRLSDEHTRAVTLVFSELATNAIMHGAPPFRIRVGVHDHLTHIEVRDVGAGSVMPRSAGTLDGGYGLNLVKALASRWGSNADPSEGTKTVWADIDEASGL